MPPRDSRTPSADRASATSATTTGKSLTQVTQVCLSDAGNTGMSV